MKFLVLLCVMIGARASIVSDIVYYTTANDQLDMKAVVEDRIKLQEFVDCFLGRKACAEVPASYLLIIPDSIITGCKKCNPAQKHLANTFLTGLKKNMPIEYENFLDKFDPERKYIETFMENVKGF